jgi:hypothetical protein
MANRIEYQIIWIDYECGIVYMALRAHDTGSTCDTLFNYRPALATVSATAVNLGLACLCPFM